MARHLNLGFERRTGLDELQQASCAGDSRTSWMADRQKMRRKTTIRAGRLVACLPSGGMVMNYTKLITAFGLAAVMAAMPASAHAQVRARGVVVVGHAGPRFGPAPFIVGPRVVVAPYAPYFRPGFNLGLSYGYPYYGPYYGYPYPYGYGYPRAGFVVGGRLGAYRGFRIAPRALRGRAR
jgi:hypothetical protein